MKTLVIDDDAISRFILIHMLNKLGIFDVVDAEDGEDAWNKLARLAPLKQGGRPAVCFCDGRMPRLSGIDLLRRMKDHPEMATIPFILVSASDDAESIEQATALGATGYISKPFGLDAVRAELDKCLKNSWHHLAESPATTLKRLNISAEQLLTYLGGFKKQLESAVSELQQIFAVEEGVAGTGAMAEQSAQEKQAIARAKLDVFRSGCLTLGLTYAATVIQNLAWPLDADGLMDGLKTVLAGVGNQMAAVKDAGQAG